MNLLELKEMSVSPSDLVLDSSNPRLFDVGKAKKVIQEKELIRRLVLTSDIQELLLSIAANGFIQLEPLVITGESKPYRVLEGNRRLAAIRLLLDNSLADDLDIKLPQLSPEVISSLTTIDVRHVENEQAAWPYIGFKHVNGPHKWSSLSKARFAARWFREEQGRVSVAEISNRLGDKHSTVRKMLEGIFVLEQAEENNLFSIDNRWPDKPFFFSHLYTALTRKEFRDFLNVGPLLAATDPVPNPVAESNIPALRTMLRWMFGDKADDVQAVVASQNPDLGRLGKVLVNPVALEILEQRRSLDVAFSETIPKDVAFREKLIASYSAGREALGHVYSYKGGDKQLENIAGQLHDIAKEIYESMQKKTPSGGRDTGRN